MLVVVGQFPTEKTVSQIKKYTLSIYKRYPMSSYTTGGEDYSNAIKSVKGFFKMIGGADETPTTTTTTGDTDAAKKIGAAAGVGLALYVIMTILQFAIFCYAIYLSVKCNQGFNFGSFLAACCCSPCYVAYRLAMGAKGCVA